MASRFVIPFAEVGNGIAPEDGAKLSFFETGTSTPKNTFSDSAATIPNTNPVISDANGLFADIFVTGTYKVVLKDKNDVQIWEADPVDEFASSGGSVKNIDTLALAVNDSSIQDGDALNIRVSTVDDGGGGIWDAVLASTVTIDGIFIVASTGGQVPPLALVQRRTTSITINIPTDFALLQDAADFYKSSNFHADKVILFIESGHLLKGGIGVFDDDYSMFEIQSADAIVSLDPAFVGVPVVQNEINGEVPRDPLFYGINSHLPSLNTVIDMDNLFGSGYFGVNSTGFVFPNKGVINSGFRGLQWRGGSVFAGSGNFSGATGSAARVQKAGKANLGGANLDNACKTEDLINAALYVSRSCIVEARTATIKNSGAAGIIARRSIVTATDCDVSNPTLGAFVSESGAIIDAINSICAGAPAEVFNARFGGIITAAGATITTPSQANRVLVPTDGGIITVNGATTVDAVAVGLVNLSTDTPNFNMTFGDGIVYHPDFQAVFQTGSNSDGRWTRFADGRMITWSELTNIDIGTIASGSFSGQITMPTLPQTFVRVDDFRIEAVGKETAGGGGRTVFVKSSHGMNPVSNDWKIFNEGVQLNGAGSGISIATVQFMMVVFGTWK